MNGRLALILAGGLACLFGLALTGWRMAEDQKRRKRWAARRAETLGVYLAPKRPEDPSLLAVLRQRAPRTRFSLLTAVLGWREARRSHYAMSWSGVLAALAGPSLLLGWIGTKLLGPVGWSLAILADLLLTRLVLNAMLSRVSRTLLAQFPDALAMVSRSVRVGVPVAEAVRVVAREGPAPTSTEFARAADQMQIGVALETALADMASRNDLPEYRFFATALTLQAQTGGGLTETLDTLADTIRKREAARKRGHALAAEARTSIYVLTGLPVVVGAILFVINPGYIGLLFDDPLGEKMLAFACGLLCVGLFAMQQMIKRSLS